MAGHVTNFVDNEASLDFLSSSNVQMVPEMQKNFSQLMRELDSDSNT